MDISQWTQDLGLMKSNMENLSSNTTISNANSSRPQQSMNETRNTRLQKEKALNCPRCNSKNTKFCYYNNYSLTQPRYFCKTCRRYWTEGGSLRNVPIGGGSRKSKKPSTISPDSTSISLPDMVSSCSMTTASSKIVNGTNHDLNLAFSLVHPAEFPSTSTSISTPFMPLLNSMPSISFGIQDLRSNALSCPMDFTNVNRVSGADHNENNEGRLLFPFEEARMNYTSVDINGDDDHQPQQNKLPEQNGGDHHYYWNDLISGGGD